MKAGGENTFLGPIIEYNGVYSIRDKLAETIVQSDLDHIADALYPKATAQALPPRPYRPSKIKGRSQNGAGVPFLERNPDQRLFRFHQGGYLRGLLSDAMKQAGLSFPSRQRGFHLFCHTYATWILALVGDNYGLARTGRWKDPRSAEGYFHTLVSSEAKRADLLPTPNGAKAVQRA